MSSNDDSKGSFAQVVMSGDKAALAEVHGEMRQRVEALGRSAKAAVKNDNA